MLAEPEEMMYDEPSPMLDYLTPADMAAEDAYMDADFNPSPALAAEEVDMLDEGHEYDHAMHDDGETGNLLPAPPAVEEDLLSAGATPLPSGTAGSVSSAADGLAGMLAQAGDELVGKGRVETPEVVADQTGAGGEAAATTTEQVAEPEADGWPAHNHDGVPAPAQPAEWTADNAQPEPPYTDPSAESAPEHVTESAPDPEPEEPEPDLRSAEPPASPATEAEVEPSVPEPTARAVLAPEDTAPTDEQAEYVLVGGPSPHDEAEPSLAPVGEAPPAEPVDPSAEPDAAPHQSETSDWTALHSSSTRPVLLTAVYSSSPYVLFGPLEGDSMSADILLVDRPEIYFAHLDELFDSLRTYQPFHDRFEESEMVLHFPDLDLEITEDNYFARSITLHDLDRLQGSVDRYDTLRMELTEHTPRFINRYNALAELMNSADGNEVDVQYDEGEQQEHDPSALAEESEYVEQYYAVEEGGEEPSYDPEAHGEGEGEEWHGEEYQYEEGGEVSEGYEGEYDETVYELDDSAVVEEAPAVDELAGNEQESGAEAAEPEPYDDAPTQAQESLEPAESAAESVPEPTHADEAHAHEAPADEAHPDAAHADEAPADDSRPSEAPVDSPTESDVAAVDDTARPAEEESAEVAFAEVAETAPEAAGEAEADRSTSATVLGDDDKWDETEPYEEDIYAEAGEVDGEYEEPQDPSAAGYANGLVDVQTSEQVSGQADIGLVQGHAQDGPESAAEQPRVGADEPKPVPSLVTSKRSFDDIAELSESNPVEIAESKRIKVE